MKLTLLSALLLLAVCAACAAPNQVSPQGQRMEPTAISRTAPSPSTLVYTVGIGESIQAPGYVVVFDPASSKPYQTITSGLVRPGSIAFGTRGNLYVANYFATSFETHTIQVYPPGGATPSRTISFRGIGDIRSIAIDHRDNLIVYSLPGYKPTITVVAPSGTVIRTLSIPGTGGGIALDSQNNIYLADTKTNAVHVYSPLGAALLRTLNVSSPAHPVLDSKDTLYVQGYVGNKYGVLVFAPQSTTLLRSITNGVMNPEAVAFDSAGRIYISNGDNRTITVYAPNSATLLRTLVPPNDYAVSLAVAPNGYLYALGSYALYAFPPGSTSPSQTYTPIPGGQQVLVHAK